MTISRNLADLALGIGSSGILGPTNGGTSATTLPANNVILGNGTTAVQFVAPGTSGNALFSNGTTWIASNIAGASGFSGTSGTIGISGFSGVSGTSGISGYSSTSGFSGVSGFSGLGSAGGGGGFNTNNNNVIGFAVTSSLSSVYTASATAGLRYIVYSVHVTNIGTASANISGSFNGSTYSNISFAQSVPLPVGSSVELFKMPKIMQPSDVLRLQASADTTLHATISYETQTSSVLFGAGVSITSAATYTDLYTATGVCVVQSVLLSNIDTTFDAKARVVWTDGSNNIQGYYSYDLIVPQGATVEVMEASKGLPSTYKVRVYCNVANRLQAIIAGKVSA
jgi:hypothetical protein